MLKDRFKFTIPNGQKGVFTVQKATIHGKEFYVVSWIENEQIFNNVYGIEIVQKCVSDGTWVEEKPQLPKKIRFKVQHKETGTQYSIRKVRINGEQRLIVMWQDGKEMDCLDYALEEVERIVGEGTWVVLEEGQH